MMYSFLYLDLNVFPFIYSSCFTKNKLCEQPIPQIVTSNQLSPLFILRFNIFERQWFVVDNEPINLQ